jgi:phosphopantetheine--protein transferase-like protein
VDTALADALQVSIAHKDGIAVAIARRGRGVGIDVERIEARSASFAELSFTESELRLVADMSTEEGQTLLWAVKEAAAKALGTGLTGNPRKFPVRDRAGSRWLVGEQWIQTKRHQEYVIAWTET